MDTRGTSYRQVAQMEYAADEAERMAELNVLWVQTMDLKHDNFLAYMLDIQVEDIDDICQRKYIDTNDFFPYKAENGSEWMVSKAIELQDLDQFFKVYLHDEELEAA